MKFTYSPLSHLERTYKRPGEICSEDQDIMITVTEREKYVFRNCSPTISYRSVEDYKNLKSGRNPNALEGLNKALKIDFKIVLRGHEQSPGNFSMELKSCAGVSSADVGLLVSIPCLIVVVLVVILFFIFRRKKRSNTEERVVVEKNPEYSRGSYIEGGDLIVDSNDFY